MRLPWLSLSLAVVATSASGAAGHLLYDQSDNDNGTGIPSLHFLDSGFEVYDCVGADDFRVPVGKIWTIT